MLLAPRRIAALVVAIATLVVAGFAQELLLLSRHAELGITVVIPILILVAWLWRPGPEAVALVLVALGVELLLPLQTGGGRSEDWLLHYQISLNYAGLPNGAYLLGRTPLFHQVIASVLRHSPAYWTFQVLVVLLNSLWLWPATLLIDGVGRNRRALRLFAVGLAPVVLAYSTYTWPWNFSAFFLLSALWLEGEEGWVAEVGIGTALAAALLTHPGSIGYVVGLGAWWLFKRHRSALPGVAAGLCVLASSVPWMLAVTGSRGPGAMLSGSIPAVQRVPPVAWLISRLLLAAHTIVPPVGFPGDRLWVNLALGFLILTLPGALITVLAAGRLNGIHKATVATIATGAAISLAIYPANQDATGMLDGLYLGVLVYLIDVAARAHDQDIARVFGLSAVLGAMTIVALAWLGFAPVAGDVNGVLRARYNIDFFEQRWGWAPGALALALSLALGVRAVLVRTPGGGSPMSLGG